MCPVTVGTAAGIHHGGVTGTQAVQEAVLGWMVHSHHVPAHPSPFALGQGTEGLSLLVLCEGREQTPPPL
jgi:hypothetical protein